MLLTYLFLPVLNDVLGTSLSMPASLEFTM